MDSDFTLNALLISTNDEPIRLVESAINGFNVVLPLNLEWKIVAVGGKFLQRLEGGEMNGAVVLIDGDDIVVAIVLLVSVLKEGSFKLLPTTDALNF